MSCFHPYMRWEDRSGKVEFTTVETKFPKIERMDGTLQKPIIIEQESLHGFHKTNPHWKRVDLIPCNQCLGCRMDYSRQWATRIALECQEHPQDNWFVTLTFSPENIWKTEHATVNTITGELAEGYSVKKEHLQTFLKDLRRYWKYHYNHDGIRFYGVGEYGSERGRPHYHICLFNIPIPESELEKWFINNCGDQIYKCKILEKIWHENGLVAIGKVTWESAAYVARYMLKKQKGENAWIYASEGIQPEFSLMSRMPGIGKEYFNKNKDQIYEYDEIILEGRKLGKKVKPPKYYDKLFDIEEPERMAAIKQKRVEAAEASTRTRKKQTNLSTLQYLENKERKTEKIIQGLPRIVENT